MWQGESVGGDHQNLTAWQHHMGNFTPGYILWKSDKDLNYVMDNTSSFNWDKTEILCEKIFALGYITLMLHYWSVLCMNAFNERSFMNSFIFWANGTHVFLPDEHFVNGFILAFVNGAFLQFNFVQDSARFPLGLPGGNRLKHTVSRPLHVAGKHPVWLLCLKSMLDKRFVLYFRSKRNLTISDRNSCILNMKWGITKRTQINSYWTDTTLATPASTESHRRIRHQYVKDGGKNKWRQQHYLRLWLHH